MLMSVLWRREQIVPFLDRISAVLSHADYPAQAVVGVRLALEEAVINGFQHGNKNDKSKCVCVCWRVSPNEFVVQIQDEGAGFDIASVPDPTLLENLHKPSGRGLLLMHQFMTSVEFSANGARVTMKKLRSA
jgi:serine/threonine-protein kinase RsbW